MKLFLTSSIGGSYKENGKRIPCALEGANHFLDLLREHWAVNSKCLVISSDPENDVINDSFKAIFTEAFRISGFSLSQLDICDRRNESKLADIIYDYDVLLLAGGHVPTQNQFFSRIKLKELMGNYKGIIIGISAGTMNCADVVYAQPELDGEATSLVYQRYLNGLNLTNLNILPHFQDIKDISVDGQLALEDISLPDSWTRPFYALVDGSFIFIDDNKTTLYGEAYWVQNGNVTRVCENDKSIQLI